MRSITDFQIRTINGHILSGSADELHILSRFINDEGIQSIAKVSFYYEDQEDVGSRAFHNLILRNEGDREPRFSPEFSTTLIAEQCVDLALAIQLLKSHDDLHDQIAQFILWPVDKDARLQDCIDR
jgi:hypothetical protein